MSNQHVHPAFGGIVRSLSGDLARSATAHGITHVGPVHVEGEHLSQAPNEPIRIPDAELAAMFAGPAEAFKLLDAQMQEREAFYREADRGYEQQKAAGFPDRYERALQEQMNRRPA